MMDKARMGMMRKEDPEGEEDRYTFAGRLFVPRHD